MRANNRRKVFGDAVDLLMEDIEEKTAAGGLRMLPIKRSGLSMIIHFICTKENAWKIWLPV